MVHHLRHLQLLATGESSGPFPRICPSHTIFEQKILDVRRSSARGSVRSKRRERDESFRSKTIDKEEKKKERSKLTTGNYEGNVL